MKGAPGIRSPWRASCALAKGSADHSWKDSLTLSGGSRRRRDGIWERLEEDKKEEFIHQGQLIGEKFLHWGWLEAVLIQAKILPFGISCVPPVRLLHCHRKKKGLFWYWIILGQVFLSICLHKSTEGNGVTPLHVGVRSEASLVSLTLSDRLFDPFHSFLHCQRSKVKDRAQI